VVEFSFHRGEADMASGYMTNRVAAYMMIVCECACVYSQYECVCVSVTECVECA
jgi:hypothetical protein